MLRLPAKKEKKKKKKKAKKRRRVNKKHSRRSKVEHPTSPRDGSKALLARTSSAHSLQESPPLGSTFVTFIIHPLTLSHFRYLISYRREWYLRGANFTSGLHSHSEPKPCRAPGRRALGTAALGSRVCQLGSLPAGVPAFASWLCIAVPDTQVLAEHDPWKEKLPWVAFCLTIAKSCPRAVPASPAWDSLLPLSLPKAGPALLQGPRCC